MAVKKDGGKWLTFSCPEKNGATITYFPEEKFNL